MSIFDQASTLGPEASQFSAVPLTGLIGSFKAAWDEQVKTASSLAAEIAFFDAEYEQDKKLRDNGITPPEPLFGGAFDYSDRNVNDVNSLDDVREVYSNVEFAPTAPRRQDLRNYVDVLDYFNNGGPPETAAKVEAYTQSIEKLRTANPELGLKTPREMVDAVKQQAAEAQKKAEQLQTTTLGDVGYFAGAAAASLNPITDPINFYTLPVGGFGRTAIARIGTEVAANVGVEGVNQLAAVGREREMLGLQPVDPLVQMLYAGAGAAVVQGLGEAVGAAGRRLFPDAPETPPPSPPPPTREPITDPSRPLTDQRFWLPGGETLAVEEIARDPDLFHIAQQVGIPFANDAHARARANVDMDHVAEELYSWTGRNPADIEPPKYSTAIGRVQYMLDALPEGYGTKPLHEPLIDGLARRIDPDVFREYDPALKKQSFYQLVLDRLNTPIFFGGANIQKPIDFLNDMYDEIFSLETSAKSTGKERAKAKRRIKELEGVIRSLSDRLNTERRVSEGQDIGQLYRDYFDNLQTLRRLEPSVHRAYARAKGKWTLDGAETDAVRKALTAGETEVRFTPDPTPPVRAAPPARRAPSPPSDAPPRTPTPGRLSAPAAGPVTEAPAATASAATAARVAEAQKFEPKVLADAENTINRLDLEDAAAEIKIDGYEGSIKLNADIPIELEDGANPVSLKEAVAALQKDAKIERAISVCSVK